MSDPSGPRSTSGPSASGLPPQPGDAEHDAWLNAALRHAPDADASPPESLRRSILDEARAAAFASARASRSDATTSIASTRRPNAVMGTVAAFWTWLARPAVAASFASVMAATLVGVMWWDRPLDETLPSATPPVDALREAPATAAQSLSKAEQFAPTPAAPVASSTALAPSIQPVPSKPVPMEDKRARAEVERAPAAKKLDATAAESTANATTENATTTRDAAPMSDTAIAAAAPRPFAAPSSMTRPASLAKAAPLARDAAPDVGTDPTRSKRPSDDPLGKIKPQSAPAGAFPASPVPIAPAAVARPEPRSRMALGAAVSSAVVSGPLGDVLASLGAEPARWSVRKANGTRVAVDDALRAWLARVDATGDWHASRAIDSAALEASKTAETAASESTTTLTLLRDGELDTVVRISGDHVVVERHGRAAGQPTTAAVPAQTAADLVLSLPTSAR